MDLLAARSSQPETPAWHPRNAMPDLKSLRYQDEIQNGQARRGTVAVVCGKLLLWIDVVLLAFVFMGIRDGSWFWVWWVLGQGVLGIALMMGGTWYRRHHVS
jgi:hypothetical protein